MTQQTPEDMKLDASAKERIDVLIAAYGPVHHWPEEDQARYGALVEREDHFAGVLSAAEDLDDMLSAMPGVEPSANLDARLLASFDGAQRKPGIMNGLRARLYGIGDLFELTGGLASPAIALSAFAVAGFFAGLMGTQSSGFSSPEEEAYAYLAGDIAGYTNDGETLWTVD